MTPVAKSSMLTSAKPLPLGLMRLLEEILASAGLKTCYVTSIARTPREQAVAMLDNCIKTDVETQENIYLPAGDAVLKVVEDNWYLTATNSGKQKLIDLMTNKINDVGPENVSHHCLGEDAPIWVCDISQQSIQNHQQFQDACKKHKQFKKLLVENTVFHLELLKEVPQLIS